LLFLRNQFSRALAVPIAGRRAARRHHSIRIAIIAVVIIFIVAIVIFVIFVIVIIIFIVTAAVEFCCRQTQHCCRLGRVEETQVCLDSFFVLLVFVLISRHLFHCSHDPSGRRGDCGRRIGRRRRRFLTNDSILIIVIDIVIDIVALDLDGS
jgi:hypothetical protein